MKSDMLMNELTHRYETMSQLIDAAKKKMHQFPEGRLKFKKQDGRVYYYYINDNKNPAGRLLGKDERKLAQTLAQKSYISKILKTAEEEHKVIKHAIEKYPDVPVEKIYESLPPERKALINPIVLPDDEYLKQWLEKPYTKKPFEEGAPSYPTLKGDLVRSKSEALIANRLFAAGIPYKYECPLKLMDETIHPDFTILRIRDRKILYYEHFGKADDKKYANERIVKRINDYDKAGITQGDQLFMTFESSVYPFDTRCLEALIKKHFL